MDSKVQYQSGIVIYDFVPKCNTLARIPINEGSYIRARKFKDGWYLFKAKELVFEDGESGNGNDNENGKKNVKDQSSAIIEITVPDINNVNTTIKYKKVKGFISESFIKLLPENTQYNPIADRQFKDFEEFYYISVKRIARGESIGQSVFIDKLFGFNDSGDDLTKKFLKVGYPFPDILFEHKSHILKYNKFLLLLLIKVYSILRDNDVVNFGWAVYAISENLPFKLNDDYLDPLLNMDTISDSLNQLTFLWFIILENFEKSKDFVPKMFSYYQLQLYSRLHERLFDNISSNSTKFYNYFNSFLLNYQSFDKVNDIMVKPGNLDVEDINNIINNLSELIIVFSNNQQQQQQKDNSDNSNNSNNSSSNIEISNNSEVKELIDFNLNKKKLSLPLKCYLLSIPRFQDFQDVKVELLDRLFNENQQMFLNVIQHYQKNQQLDIIKLLLKKIIDEKRESKLFDIQFSNFIESYSRDISQLFTVSSFKSLLEYLFKYNVLNNGSHKKVLQHLGRYYLERLDNISTNQFIEILQLSLKEPYTNFFQTLGFKFKKYYSLKQHSENKKEIKDFIDSINIPKYQLSNPSNYPVFNDLLSKVMIFIVSDDAILHREIERRLLVVKNMNYILQVFNHMFENQQSAYTKLVFRELSSVFIELKELQQFHQNILLNKEGRDFLFNRMHEFSSWEDRIKSSIKKAIVKINNELVDKDSHKTKEQPFNQSEVDSYAKSFIDSIRKCFENNYINQQDEFGENHNYSLFIKYILNSLNLSYPSELITQDDASTDLLKSSSIKSLVTGDDGKSGKIQFPDSIFNLFSVIEELFVYLHQSFIWYYQRKSQDSIFKVTYSHSHHGKAGYLLKHNVSTIKNIYNQMCRIVTYFNYCQKQDKTFQDCLSVFTYFKPIFFKTNDINNELYQEISKEITTKYFTIENGFGVLEKGKIFNYFINKIQAADCDSNDFAEFTVYLRNICQQFSKKEQEQFENLQYQLYNNNNNDQEEEAKEKNDTDLESEKRDFINLYISEVMTLIMDLFISEPNFRKELDTVKELWRILNNGNSKSDQNVFDASAKSLGDFTELLKENSHISSITTQTTDKGNDKLEIGHLENVPTLYELRQSKKMLNQLLRKDYSVEPITDYDEGKHMLLFALALNKNSYKIWYYLGRYLKYNEEEFISGKGRLGKKDFYIQALEKLPDKDGVNKLVHQDILKEIKECENCDSVAQWDNEKVCSWLDKNSILKNYINNFKQLNATGETLLDIYNSKNFNDYNLKTIGSQKNFIYEMNIILGIKRLNKINSDLPVESLSSLEKDHHQISKLIVKRKFSVVIAYGFIVQEINGIAFLSLEEEDYKYLGITNDQQRQILTSIIKSYYEVDDKDI